jgi:hypothetical protein
VSSWPPPISMREWSSCIIMVIVALITPLAAPPAAESVKISSDLLVSGLRNLAGAPSNSIRLAVAGRQNEHT